MTFSLVARDPDTGAFGMVVSSSSPAVASRCLHLRAGVGAVASQNVTNPALGPAVLDALEGGEDATEALSTVLASEAHPDYRQITVVDSHGITALHSGPNALGIHTDVEGDQAVAAGNMLATPDVPEKLLAGYLGSDADTFEGRLLDGLKAGLAEGGEAGPVRSAGLGVVDDVPWLTTDLRVDDHDGPIGELERLLGVWMPQKADYRTRGLDPTDAPSYGVPGDE
jgi:uncharacterized Ntn-hydrolase superfamily protein